MIKVRIYKSHLIWKRRGWFGKWKDVKVYKEGVDPELYIVENTEEIEEKVRNIMTWEDLDNFVGPEYNIKKI